VTVRIIGSQTLVRILLAEAIARKTKRVPKPPPRLVAQNDNAKISK